MKCYIVVARTGTSPFSIDDVLGTTGGLGTLGSVLVVFTVEKSYVALTVLDGGNLTLAADIGVLKS